MEGYRDAIEITKKKFIGKPLKRLYERHSVSRGGFALFLEDGERKPLGKGPNLSFIILKNKEYPDFPVKDITRSYEELHVIIERPADA